MNIKMEAATAIANALSIAVPSVPCKAGQADQEEYAIYPSIRVLPQRMRFTPWQEEIIEVPNPLLWDQALFAVGEFEGTFEIRIYTPNKPQREAIEEQINTLLFEREGMGGTLTATTRPIVLNDKATLHEAQVVCYLNQEGWHDERAFEKKFFSFIELDTTFQALVLRTAYTLDHLYLSIATDLEKSTPDSLEIKSDGALKPEP